MKIKMKMKKIRIHNFIILQFLKTTEKSRMLRKNCAQLHRFLYKIECSKFEAIGNLNQKDITTKKIKQEKWYGKKSLLISHSSKTTKP